MQVHATGEYSSAIIIDHDSISRLWKHLEDFSPGVSATLSCVDGIERIFENLEDLIAYENSPRTAVKTLVLFSRAPEKSISVTLGRSFGAKAALSISGEEQDVTVVRTKIMDLFAGMRAWYSPIATLNLEMVLFVVFIASTLVMQLMAPVGVPSRPERNFSEAVQALGNLVLYIIPVIVIVYFISRVKRRFFPMVSTAIGQGGRRHATDEQVRWTVIVGLIVSLVGSAIYAWMSGS